MRKLMMTSASIALIVGVAACSSTPEPEPVVVEEPVEVVEEPEEVVVVEETLPVVPTGPTAGSLEDFQVNVGDRVYFDLDSSGRFLATGSASEVQDDPDVQAAYLGGEVA